MRAPARCQPTAKTYGQEDDITVLNLTYAPAAVPIPAAVLPHE